MSKIFAVTDQVAIMFAMLAHANADGLVEGTDEDFAVWSNEIIEANQPLTRDQRNLMLGIAAKNDLTMGEIKTLKDLADKGLGLRDIRFHVMEVQGPPQ
jgi:hypothetical protein